MASSLFLGGGVEEQNLVFPTTKAGALNCKMVEFSGLEYWQGTDWKQTSNLVHLGEESQLWDSHTVVKKYLPQLC